VSRSEGVFSYLVNRMQGENDNIKTVNKPFPNTIYFNKCKFHT